MLRTVTLALVAMACLPLVLSSPAGWIFCIHACGELDVGSQHSDFADQHCASGHHAEMPGGSGDCSEAESCVDLFLGVELLHAGSSTSLSAPGAVGLALSDTVKPVRREPQPAQASLPPPHLRSLSVVVLLI